MQEYGVFYQKPMQFRDGVLGFEWLEARAMLPKPSALSDTHVYLGQFKSDTLESLYMNMQAERWSPNGEKRYLIKSKGLAHTSMSVGDIAVDKGGVVWMVDVYGWKRLN